MDPMIGYVLLAAGALLYVALVVRMVRSPTGDRKSVRARDVSGQVVVADRVEGGVTQHQVQPAPGRPESKAPGKVREAFDRVKLILAIPDVPGPPAPRAALERHPGRGIC